MLSFDEFSKRPPGIPIPGYGNFFMYFATGTLIGFAYQEKEHFIRFSTEYPKMTEKLCKMIKEEVCDKQIDPPESIDEPLYIAYTIMSNYGVSDTDLFS